MFGTGATIASPRTCPPTAIGSARRVRMSSSPASPESLHTRAARLMSEAMDDAGRVDVVRLVEQHPELAQQFRELSANEAFLEEGFEQDREVLAAQRAEVERLLEAIREATRPGRRYRLGAQIGQGGMGVVRRVNDAQLDRELAMKVIRGSESAAAGETSSTVTPRQLKRFLNEARITGRLDHPGIVPVHDVGVDGDGRAYFTMKLVEGLTLEKVFELHRAGDPNWSLPRVLNVLQRVSEALAFAHGRRVIHRDLKPANVMVGGFGEVYLMDWGVARDLDIAEDVSSATVAAIVEAQRDADDELRRTLTLEGDVLGTPAYMSPEQARGEVELLEPRSDVYSLGAMLYELLAGRAPHTEPYASRATAAPRAPTADGATSTAASAHLVLQRLLSGAPAPLLDRAHAPELVAIQEKAMARSIDERYPSASEFAADLQRFVEGRAVHAFETGAWAETKKWVQRNKLLAGSIAVALVALLVGVSVSLFFKAMSDRNATDAALATQKAQERSRDVLALSAQSDLDNHLLQAESLWPPYPAMIPLYEEWLRKSEEFVLGTPEGTNEGQSRRLGLPTYNAQLAELRKGALPPTSKDRQLDRESHSSYRALQLKISELEWRERMLGMREWPETSAIKAHIAEELTSSDPVALNSRAWKIVNPASPVFGREIEALLLAQLAVSLGHPRLQGDHRDTLAWAHFRTGSFDAAIDEERRALNEPGGAYLESSLSAMLDECDRWSTAKRDTRLSEIHALRGDVDRLEQLVSERRTYHYTNSELEWWDERISELIATLQQLERADVGIAGNAIGAQYGWGVRKRLEFARQIEAESISGTEPAAAWAEAITAIQKSPLYKDLTLSPQIGLIPVGADPRSGLWEFAHLQSGSVPNRDTEGELLFDDASAIVLVLLPGGSYLMGSQSNDPEGANYESEFDPQRTIDAFTVHSVELTPFFISKYEVTQGQWRRLTGENPSFAGPDNYNRQSSASGAAWKACLPVERVSWTSSDLWVRRAGLCLPSDAQWEYAARGGTSTVYWTGSTAASLQDCENILDAWAEANGFVGMGAERSINDGYMRTAPVGEFRPNPFGLHDMLGNVREWCLDRFAKAYPINARDPVEVDPGSANRVNRGGGFDYTAVFARSAFRGNLTPEALNRSLGLRPARGITP